MIFDKELLTLESDKLKKGKNQNAKKNYSYKTSKQKQISIIGYIKGNCNYNDHNCTQQTFFNEKYGWSASAYQLWSDGMSDILSCIRHCIVLFLDKSVKKI